MSNLLLLDCLKKSKVKKVNWIYKQYLSSTVSMRYGELPVWSDSLSVLVDRYNKNRVYDFKDLKGEQLFLWPFFNQNPFLIYHIDRQKLNKPLRYTIFKGFLDDKLRFGGSHLVKLENNYLLI